MQDGRKHYTPPHVPQIRYYPTRQTSTPHSHPSPMMQIEMIEDTQRGGRVPPTSNTPRNRATSTHPPSSTNLTRLGLTITRAGPLYPLTTVMPATPNKHLNRWTPPSPIQLYQLACSRKSAVTHKIP